MSISYFSCRLSFAAILILLLRAGAAAQQEGSTLSTDAIHQKPLESPLGIPSDKGGSVRDNGELRDGGGELDPPDEASAAGRNLSPDPSGRVGRLRKRTGSVTLRAAGETRWVVLDRNRPLTSGDALWVAEKSHASFQFSRHQLSVGPQSFVEIAQFSDRSFHLGLGQGEIAIELDTLLSSETVALETPEGTITLDTPGLYQARVFPGKKGTHLTVLRGGHASSSIGQSAWEVRSGEEVDLGFDKAVGPTIRQTALGPQEKNSPRDIQAAPAPEASPSLRYVSRETVGYEDLDASGSWAESGSYGPLWRPTHVPRGWAPYRYGHWAFIAPWGYTWIDDMPWAFAPSHYGRWVFYENNWGWSPSAAPDVSPIYAPALVAFIGGGVIANASIGAGNVGWFPLGYGEIYTPGYRTSYRYVRGINGYASQLGRLGRGTEGVAPSLNQQIPNAVTAVDGRVISQGTPIGPGRSIIPINSLTHTSASTSILPAAFSARRDPSFFPTQKHASPQPPPHAYLRPALDRFHIPSAAFRPAAQQPLVYRAPHNVWPTHQPFTPMPHHYQAIPAYRSEPIHQPTMAPAWRTTMPPIMPRAQAPSPHFVPMPTMPTMHFSPHGGRR